MKRTIQLEIRATPTKTGYWYYFDAYGHAYVWWRNELLVQKQRQGKNAQTIKRNKNGGYLTLNRHSSINESNRGCMAVHKGVAQAFPEISGEPNLFQNQIDHKNGDMLDNRAKNLRWVSAKENCRYRDERKKAKKKLENL